MISPVFIFNAELPPIDEKEVLRYAGEKKESVETNRLLQSCIKESGGRFSTFVSYRILPIRHFDSHLQIGPMEIRSDGLRKSLYQCNRVILFAASAGMDIDRLIAKHSKLSPARALLFHSIGAERVEALCNVFCDQISRDLNVKLSPRFSPGYGDLPLTLQSEILSLLDAQHTLGIGLNESLLLSPSKSVTAFAGIYETKE